MSFTVAFAESSLLTVPDRATKSLDSFLRWRESEEVPEDARVWFFNGEVWVDLNVEELDSHLNVKGEITRVLGNLAKESKSGKVYPDGLLLTNREANLSGEPDMVFISNETLAAGRVKRRPGRGGGHVGLEGTPDMVLEVVSDGSEKKDNQTLFEAYFDAGIPEYWIVDARGEEVEFTIYRHAGKKYAATRAQAGGWVKSAVFGKSFRLVRGTDAGGNPEFTLEVR
jgi:Uma2 family endonuclease